MPDRVNCGIFEVPAKPNSMFRDTYFICGLIFCVCIIAIVFAIKILRETKMNEQEADKKSPPVKTTHRK